MDVSTQVYYSGHNVNTSISKSSQSFGKIASLPLIWQRMHSSAACVLAVQCPLQTSSVTQLRVHYIHTMIPHQSLDSHTRVPGIQGGPKNEATLHFPKYLENY